MQSIYDFKQDGLISETDYSYLKKRVLVQDSTDLKVFQQLAQQDLRGQCQEISRILQSARQAELNQNYDHSVLKIR